MGSEVGLLVRKISLAMPVVVARWVLQGLACLSYGISGQMFGFISSFLINRQLRVLLDGKSSQKYPVNTGVPEGSIFGPTLFLLYINDLPDNIIYNIAIYADDNTL